MSLRSARAIPAALSLGIVLLALAVRLYGLGDESLWLDEAYAFEVSARPLPESLALIAGFACAPPLHFVFLHLWMIPFGESELALRSLSALAGTAAVWVSYLLGRRIFGPAIGLASGILLALSPFHVFYSQEARVYALLSLFSVAAIYALFRLYQDPESRGWLVGYVLSALAILYSHYYGFLVLFSHAVLVAFLAWRSHKASLLTRWALAAGLVGIGFLPWLVAYSGDLGGCAQFVPIPLALAGLTEALAEAAFRLTYLRGGPSDPWTADPLAFWLFVTAVAGFVTLYLMIRRRSVPASGEEDGRIAFVTGWLLILPLSALLASALVVGLFINRGLIGSLPALYLIAAWVSARGLSALLSTRGSPSGTAKWITRAGLAIPLLLVSGYLVTTSLVGLANVYRLQQKEPWREAAAFVAQNVREGDLIALGPGYIRDPFLYYFAEDAFLVEVHYDEAVSLQPRLEDHGRVWAVSRYYGGTDTWLAMRGLEPTLENEWFGIRAALYDLRDDQ